MNLFREVRRRRSASSSSSGRDREEEPVAPTSAPSEVGKTPQPIYANGGHASLRRGPLPRSRTTASDFGGPVTPSEVPSKEDASSHDPKHPAGTLSASATSSSITKVTDWSYCSQPPKQPPTGAPRPRPPARSASLGRADHGSYTRSLTMPNFHDQEEQQGPQGQPQFSTFRKQQQQQQQSLDGGVRYRQHQPGSGPGSRGRRRPLSADVSSSSSSSVSVPPVIPPRKNSNSSSSGVGGLLPTSNSEFFRAINDRLLQQDSPSSLAASKEVSSLESLLDDDGNYIVTTGSEFEQTSCSASAYNSLELLNEADEDAMLLRKKAAAAAEGEAEGELHKKEQKQQALSVATAAAAKSNSLPKSAFGSIQLKVMEIKEQLDVLKTQKPGGTGSAGAGSGMPGVAAAQSAQKSALQLFGLQNYFQSPPGSSSQDTDSMSPRSISPAAPPVRQQQPGPKAAAAAAPPLLPLKKSKPQSLPTSSAATTTADISNSSTSPSTLSPCSSNSLPSSTTAGSAARQQAAAAAAAMAGATFRMPQSNSFSHFGSVTGAGAASTLVKACKDDSDVGSVNPADRLIFFFDIMSTQEKIAKVTAGLPTFWQPWMGKQR